MILEIRRRIKDQNFTMGDLFVDDVLFSQVVEDTDRGLMFQMPLEEIKARKVYGKTAIPTGVYEVVFNYSAKFKQELPLLLNVPGYQGIRIHSGNTEADSLGCPLPGTQLGNKVINSRATCKKLFALMKKASKTEKIYVFVTNYDS
jgi:Family of unknown function (DUF5675)